MSRAALPRLVGRAKESGELDRELRRAAGGELRSVLVVAEPGLGKSRLTAELASRHRRWTTALVARGHPLGATASFGLWAEALEHHLAQLQPETVRQLCGSRLDDLSGLLGSVAAVRGGPPEREAPRLRLLEGLTSLLRNLSRVAPLIVVLDDVHLADASSMDALGYLSRNLAGSPVLVIATARPVELARNELARETLLALEQDGLLRRVPLQPLDHGQLRQLAEAVLMGGRAPDALVDWLQDRSLGNPLFAIGLMRSLIDGGGDIERPQLARLPEELGERIQLRLRVLSPSALATLELMAVLGQRVAVDDLVHVSGRPLERMAELLSETIEQRLVIEEERGRELEYEISHPLFQEAIYQGMSRARQRALHSQIARSLVAAGRLAQAAAHFVRSAGPGDQEAIAAVLSAFRQAEERQSHGEAMVLLEALLALIPAADPRWLKVLDVMAEDPEWVVDHKADAYAAAGIEAMRRIERLVEASSDLNRRGLVKLRLTNFLAFGAGDLEEGERCARQALELFEQAGQSGRARTAANELGWIRGLRGDLPAQVEAATLAIVAGDEAGDRVLTMQALGSLAWASIHLGRRHDSESSLRRAVEMARAEGRMYRLTWCLSFLAFGQAAEGRVGEARELLAEARAGNPAYPDTVLLEIAAWVEWIAGRFDSSAGSWLQSAAMNRGALAGRRGWGVPPAVVSLAELGRLPEARLHLTAAAGRGQWNFALHMCRWADGVLTEREGDAGAAVDALTAAARALIADGHLAFASFVLLDLAECASRARYATAADWAAGELQSISERIEDELQAGMAALARAWALLAGGRGAAEQARMAAARLEPLSCEVFWGRAQEALGLGLASADREASISALASAVAIFDRSGAGWRRDRANEAMRELGQAGRRAAGRHGGVALSSRERDVALLAVEGLTARQIGERLHIGERTVETHLANLYVKLGVESKRELLQHAEELGLRSRLDVGAQGE
ncbi:AAA family ATPase [Candidatus Nephthysia bennettiae]|uniref:AAA family ATPase n=1 Tax=Candidatus Nephthysia bennettiae TaxID=3127016 RepID=A0A934K1K0_9BACT|nr:AAA family ATPase [Candidatus Dormibacteraeota bacterium]